MLAIIDRIELADKFVTYGPLPPEGYPDPDDVMFAEVFITSNADALITGSLRHYKPLLKQNAAVLSPTQVIERFFPGKLDARGQEMILKMNWKTLAEKYHLKDIA